MRGKIASLNAAVAGSVLLFAAAQQRPAADAAAVVEAEAEPAPVETKTSKPKKQSTSKKPAKPKAGPRKKKADESAPPEDGLLP